MPKRALLAAVLLVAAVAVPAAAPPAFTASATAAPGHGALERAVIARVNAIRRHIGVRRLRLHRGLGRAADRQCAAILRTDVFSHTPDGRPVGPRLRRFVGARAVGETLAWSTPGPGSDAAAVVAMWMASPGHRAALLSARFRRAGVGRRHGSLGATPAAVTTVALASAR